MTKHLYIHLPLCQKICTFCDFKRELIDRHNPKKVVQDLVDEIERKQFSDEQFSSIYLGGGTPNVFDDELLDYFLSKIKKYAAKTCEFTIECNPDLVTKSQAQILKKNLVNRASVGIQIVNNKILKYLNRTHDINHCYEAMQNLYDAGITNINIDLMYALPHMKKEDVLENIKFIKKTKPNHISFYGLDLKPGAYLTKTPYKIDLDQEAMQLRVMKAELNKINYKRYEVANWCRLKKYQSVHNKAYWLTKDYAAIGWGAHGFENKVEYYYDGSIQNWQIKKNRLTDEQFYQRVLIMGLRLKDGVDITKEPYKTAYEKYQNKLKFVTVKNNHLRADNIDLLNNSIIDILE
ncbi:coproporphyrinogen III oxidase [Mycoplasmoides gallisepticum str. F]|uniref:radical SAM family heme chaperone HemW n=1 Tax=Mycoplasmoides gallisepticum TaxID=2096 RepID=UPI0001C399C4|nr:radical SAM family heme chaperone HemW [Mycoplasmoides gallisepticum]ADC31118.1 coproporphyrinogen III oxidase [Mycoplasmoides gallisepticum str. F]UQZ95348.1 radical SAM family heme chaperone HemW [Mycoplasmoides gallisepticum]